MDSAPPGIDIPPAGLSFGDIDEVAQLCGQVPEKLTISSNPPGLDILEDKVRYSTPVSFDWPDRSIPTIEPRYRLSGVGRATCSATGIQAGTACAT